MYKKIAKEVSVFESKVDKAQVVAEASKLLGIELTEEKLQTLKGFMQEFMRLGDKNLSKFKKKMKNG